MWIQTTFEATYFDITRRDTQNGILAAMALGLFMNAAISDAFDDAGWVFACFPLITQITRGIVTSARAPTPPLRQHYRRALTWLLVSAPSTRIASPLVSASKSVGVGTPPSRKPW